MNKRIKKKWLKALCSGEYIQGIDYLVTVDDKGNDNFCCLGVLCNIHAEENNLKWEEPPPYERNNALEYLNRCAELPREVADWAGLEDVDPGFFTTQHRKYELSGLNDEGKSFKHIAKLIDKHF